MKITICCFHDCCENVSARPTPAGNSLEEASQCKSCFRRRGRVRLHVRPFFQISGASHPYSEVCLGLGMAHIFPKEPGHSVVKS